MFILFLLLAVLCLQIPAYAQTTSTEVLGTVTDATGAVVPNAEVVLLRVATGEKRLVKTDTTGNYSFPLIEIGGYTVTVTLQGFRTQTQTGSMFPISRKRESMLCWISARPRNAWR
jgi:hypothetical protein